MCFLCLINICVIIVEIMVDDDPILNQLPPSLLQFVQRPKEHQDQLAFVEHGCGHFCCAFICCCYSICMYVYKQDHATKLIG